MLVLDDLHAADEPSLLMLMFLAGELAEMPVVVVGTYREEEAAATDPSPRVSRSCAGSSRSRSGCRLSEADVASFIELSTGVTAAERLVNVNPHETEGNPLFVGEVVRLLASEGGDRAAQGRRAPPDPAGVSTRRLPGDCAASPRSVAAC